MEFGEVLKKLRADRGMSQQMLADALGIKRTTVTNYESGSSYPSFRQLLDIVKLFDVSSDFLLGMRPGVEHVQAEEDGSEIEHFENGAIIRRHANGMIEVLKGPAENVQENVQVNAQAIPDPQNKKYISDGGVATEPNVAVGRTQIIVATQDTSGNPTFSIVNFKAAANYLAGYESQEYYEELGVVTLPRQLVGGTRQGIILQIEGDSMETKFHHGDYVAAVLLEPSEWDNVRDLDAYIVVSRTYGIQFKRIKNRLRSHGFIRCRSDNRKHPSYNIEGENLLQLFRFVLHISADASNPNEDLYGKLDNLEDTTTDLRIMYEQMKEQMDRMQLAEERRRKLMLLAGDDPDKA